jgi:hypothetical protein
MEIMGNKSTILAFKFILKIILISYILGSWPTYFRFRPTT